MRWGAGALERGFLPFASMDAYGERAGVHESGFLPSADWMYRGRVCLSHRHQ